MKTQPQPSDREVLAGLQVDDVDEAEIDESTVENVSFIDFRTFRTAGEDKDILVVGRIEMDVKVSYHHPDWDTATYDCEDGVLIPHHTVDGEKNVDVEADFNMTLKSTSTARDTSYPIADAHQLPGFASTRRIYCANRFHRAARHGY
jgi:hypothetical protein